MLNSVMMDLCLWWSNPILSLLSMIVKLLKRLGLLKFLILWLLFCRLAELICKHSKNLLGRKIRMWRYGRLRLVILFINILRRIWQGPIGMYCWIMGKKNVFTMNLASWYENTARVEGIIFKTGDVVWNKVLGSEEPTQE